MSHKDEYVNALCTERRLDVLEGMVRELRAEVQAYKDLFAIAAKNPMARQLLSALGVKKGVDQLTGGG